nr:RNA-directed DNA polymerase, eukaryota [Tanacetum cinerariifolium]
MAHNDTAFSLRPQPKDGVEMEQFRTLSAHNDTAFSTLSIVIEGVLLHDMVDRWKWTLEGSGEFSVALARKFIDNSRLIGSPKNTRWIKIVPIKVNILAWKVQFDLLPTRLNLSRRVQDGRTNGAKKTDNVGAAIVSLPFAQKQPMASPFCIGNASLVPSPIYRLVPLVKLFFCVRLSICVLLRTSGVITKDLRQSYVAITISSPPYPMSRRLIADFEIVG